MNLHRLFSFLQSVGYLTVCVLLQFGGWLILAFTVLWLVLFVTSCRTQQVVQKQTTDSVSVRQNTIIRDSTIIRDTVYKIEADSASIKAYLKCDSAGNVLLIQLQQEQGRRANAEMQLAQVGNGQTEFSVKCNADSLEMVVTQYKTTITSRDSVIEKRERRITELEQQIKDKPVVPKFYKSCTAGFWLLLLIVLGYVGWKNRGKLKGLLLKLLFKL